MPRRKMVVNTAPKQTGVPTASVVAPQPVQPSSQEQVLGEELATALKSQKFLVLVAHLSADGDLHFSQTHAAFPAQHLATIFGFLADQVK